MKKSLFISLLLPSLASATVIFQLEPPNGEISGLPGTTVGWGFSLTSDTHYLIVNGIELLPAPSLGTFTDMISLRPTLVVVGPAPSESPTVSETFNLLAETGLGSFAINPGAAPGVVAIGEIFLNYSLFTVSPNDPAFDPGINTFDIGLTVSAPARIHVLQAAPVPEPGSWAMVALGFGAFYLIFRASGRTGSHVT